ncbi:hypothetical protein M0802_014145 [Mischocyttarus mexicanus]|nr:hypothetical protein M0802_014145 [Mischocyttarus mexicanus]
MATSGDEVKKSHTGDKSETLTLPVPDRRSPVPWHEEEESDDESSFKSTQPTQPIIKKGASTGISKAPSSSVRTRASSPTHYPKDLFLREMMQEHRIEQLLEMTKELEISSKLSPCAIQTSLEQATEFHSLFLQDNEYLVSNWPPQQISHKYFLERLAIQESKCYHALKRKLTQALQDLNPASQVSSQPQGSSNKVNSRLPELTVPRFEGEYLKWPEFKAMFSSVIGERENLSELERFQYLKSAVAGSAATLINHLPPMDSSFSTAWSLLTARYENERLIVNSHLERLLALEPMKYRRSSSLLKAVDIINETTQGLLALTGQDCSNCLMVHLIVRLLDRDTRENWESTLSNSTKYPTLGQLVAFLTMRARTLETLERTTQSTSTQGSAHKKASCQNSHQTIKPKEPPLKPAQPQVSYPCDFCGGNHYVVACPDFCAMSLDNRVRTVDSLRLCCNCLGRHTLRNCNSRKRCRQCNDQHHSMLHGGNLRSIFLQRPAQTTQRQFTTSATQPSNASLTPTQQSTPASSSNKD